MNDIVVSVGVPTFNRPEGLRETLKRICQQTYRNLEIIVSDNNSSDERAVTKIITEFIEIDSRITFYRQAKNIGAINNFRFLLKQATGKYFMWAADDDFLESDYIQNCMRALQENKDAIIGITGFDVVDSMQTPVIKKEYTEYLKELPSVSAYRRMRNYILQPEYCGKYRILWGVIKKEPLIESFDEVLGNLQPGEQPKWSYMPIDFALLARGDLSVSSSCQFHAFLLPSSDGKKERMPSLKGLLSLNRRGFRAFSDVISRSHCLSRVEKSKLRLFLALEEFYATARILPYYCISAISPDLARKIKKIWFEKLMRK